MTVQATVKDLHSAGETSPAAVTAKKNNFTFDTLPAHGEEYEKQTLAEGANYINSNMVYVIVFIILTLAVYYTVGKKATGYFLGIVLLGQLVIPGGTGAGIAQLFKKG